MSTSPQTRYLRRTEDLTDGWVAELYSDGTMLIRRPEDGQRIDLDKSSVDRLRDIFAQAAGTSAI